MFLFSRKSDLLFVAGSEEAETELRGRDGSDRPKPMRLDRSSPETGRQLQKRNHALAAAHAGVASHTQATAVQVGDSLTRIGTMTSYGH